MICLMHVACLIFWLGILFQVNSESPIVTWGFAPHKLINRHAVFTLPPAMIAFYKHHMHYLSEQGVAADHRRYAIPEEGPRHYIDLDYYGLEVPRSWETMMALFHQDSIMKHGLLPWHLQLVRFQLIEAFQERNTNRILKISADAGHYLADAHVPLHTTSNYNGQFTNQRGIHGFWETRIPELLVHEFDLWTGKATYQPHWDHKIWQIILGSHQAVDSVLKFEKQLAASMSQDQKYSYEVRLTRVTKVFSRNFSKAYHLILNRQVEKRMKASIKAVGDFWYSCWVDAGQPDLAVNPLEKSKEITDYQMIADSAWRRQHFMRRLE